MTGSGPVESKDDFGLTAFLTAYGVNMMWFRGSLGEG